MKIKEKVRFWLEKHEYLRDDDNRLCANIWNDEIKEYVDINKAGARTFLRLYSYLRQSSIYLYCYISDELISKFEPDLSISKRVEIYFEVLIIRICPESFRIII